MYIVRSGRRLSTRCRHTVGQEKWLNFNLKDATDKSTWKLDLDNWEQRQIPFVRTWFPDLKIFLTRHQMRGYNTSSCAVSPQVVGDYGSKQFPVLSSTNFLSNTVPPSI